ncbi:relaxation protein [Rhodanobacter sp. BL-MT-08]
MQEDELTVLISKTAALMEQFERRCDEIDQRLSTSQEELQKLTRQLPDAVRQSAHESMQALPGQVSSQVQLGLSRPMAEYQQMLDRSGNDVGRASHALAQQIKQMARLQRLLIWKVIGVTAICFLLLLAGGIWLSMHYTRVIEENQLTADLLKTYNRADLVMCEKDQLCANVDTKGKHYGDRRQYVPVMAR